MTHITLSIFDVTPLRAVALATALTLAFTPVLAQDFDKSCVAYEAGADSAVIDKL